MSRLVPLSGTCSRVHGPSAAAPAADLPPRTPACCSIVPLAPFGMPDYDQTERFDLRVRAAAFFTIAASHSVVNGRQPVQMWRVRPAAPSCCHVHALSGKDPPR